MPCTSLGLFAGTGECNAYCKHCAGVYWRQFAPKEDGVIDEELFLKTLREAYEDGARYLTISSSGEPTLSPRAVEKTLDLVRLLGANGKRFDQVNLYTNGIVIGQVTWFHQEYLRAWMDLGLTHVYVTVHSTDERRNAKLFGIEEYPPLRRIFSRIHDAGLKTRANVMLEKGNIDTLDKFQEMVGQLAILGADSVSAWAVRSVQDTENPLCAPSPEVMDGIQSWTEKGNPPIPVRVPRDRMPYKTSSKLTLFPDGVLSNTWCN